MRQYPSCRRPNPGQIPEPGRGPDSGRNASPSALKRMALGAWLLLALGPAAVAHPIPDVPLRSFFEADGSAVITPQPCSRHRTWRPLSSVTTDGATTEHSGMAFVQRG